ncbi:MAG: hypothetical protein ACOCP4_04670, partial [Candidatus Woesearchaeota archaeon]
MNKSEVFTQIENFNDIFYKGVEKSNTTLRSYLYYVPKEEAEIKAKFINFVREKYDCIDKKINNIKNILDLCFGSGNLTTHIVLDNDLSFEKLILNDKYEEYTNQDLHSYINDYYNNPSKSTITNLDFFNSQAFQSWNNIQLVIFNPLISTSNHIRKINIEGIEDKIKIFNEDSNIKENLLAYLEKNGDFSKQEISEISVDVDDDSRKININTDQNDKMESCLTDIIIFNYYDIFINGEGSETNIVKIRKTIDTVSNNEIIIFMGESSQCYSLFKDFNFIVECQFENYKSIFVITENDTVIEEKYKFDSDDFVRVNDSKSYKIEYESDKLIQEIENNLSKVTPEELIVTDNNKDDFINKKIKKGIIPEVKDLPKNILLKGVPGTGKSRTLTMIVKNSLKIDKFTTKIDGDLISQVLRINVHSASNNADLMQGIGIKTDNDGNIVYEEKTGLVLNHIYNAIRYPNIPFVLILEEIQENSLNKLIGDLIYL